MWKSGARSLEPGVGRVRLVGQEKHFEEVEKTPIN